MTKSTVTMLKRSCLAALLLAVLAGMIHLLQVTRPPASLEDGRIGGEPLSLSARARSEEVSCAMSRYRLAEIESRLAGTGRVASYEAERSLAARRVAEVMETIGGQYGSEEARDAYASFATAWESYVAASRRTVTGGELGNEASTAVSAVAATRPFFEAAFLAWQDLALAADRANPLYRLLVRMFVRHRLAAHLLFVFCMVAFLALLLRIFSFRN